MPRPSIVLAHEHPAGTKPPCPPVQGEAPEGHKLRRATTRCSGKESPGLDLKLRLLSGKYGISVSAPRDKAHPAVAVNNAGPNSARWLWPVAPGYRVRVPREVFPSPRQHIKRRRGWCPREAAHDHPAVLRVLDQPFAFEPPKRLPHRRLRNAPARGDLFLAQVLARRHAAREDAGLQLLINRVRLRPSPRRFDSHAPSIRHEMAGRTQERINRQERQGRQEFNFGEPVVGRKSLQTRVPWRTWRPWRLERLGPRASELGTPLYSGACPT